jgi:hypothetical protein
MMFRKAKIFIFLWGACFLSAYAQESDLRVLPLDPDALTLKAVFDAGFRPRLVPRLERVICEVADEKFSISVDGRAPIKITAEWVSFNVNAEDEVTTFEARDRNLYTLDEVLAIASEHLVVLGIGTTKLREWEARQRAGMRKAATGPGPFIGAGNFSDGKWYGDRNMKAGVKIMSTYQVQAPFTLQYYAQWRSVLSMKSIRREPIKPPAGYEHVSMAPYPSGHDVEKDEENGRAEAPQQSVPPELKEPDSEAPPPPRENRNSEDTSPVWPYLLAVLVIIGIVVVLLRSRKGKPGR